MNSTTLEYRQKVWRFLEKTKPGERYTVDKLAKPENREAFMAAIKEYMASLPYNGWISFNSDFTKFYRTEAVPMEQLRRAGR
jgi:hypothetical protein